MSMDVHMTHIWFFKQMKIYSMSIIRNIQIETTLIFKNLSEMAKSDDKTLFRVADTGLLPPTLLLEAEIVIAPAESNLANICPY